VVGAATVLRRRGGRSAWPCRSAWLVAFGSGRVGALSEAVGNFRYVAKEQSVCFGRAAG
jgi:hypothetical protein